MGREKKICTSAIPNISQEPHECGKLSGVQIFLVQVTVKNWPQDHYFSQKVLLVGAPIIIITSKDNTQAFKKVDDMYPESQETGSEGHLSTIYVIIEVSPPPPWTCSLHPIPPNIQPISPPYSIQPPPPLPVGIGPTMMKIIAIAPTPTLRRVCRQGVQ